MAKDKNRTGKAPGGKRFQPEFRKFRNAQLTNHPQYVYDEDGNKYKILGITKAPETDGVLNVLLSENPEPGNPDPAYVRTKAGKVSKGVANKRLKGWRFAAEDKAKVREIIDRNEKKKPRK